MSRTTRRSLAVAVLTASAIPLCLTAPAAAAPVDDSATLEQKKNVILLIADGMGYNHVDAASLYEHGTAMYQSAEGEDANPYLGEHGSDAVASQVYQDFPVQKAQETGYVYSQPYDSIDAWASPQHATRNNPAERLNVTDSGAAATALSTGVRTKSGHLGWDKDEEPLTDMVDIASEAGLATGVVTSSRFWADTPAGFAIHGDDGDDANTITQLLEHEDLDVVMGGGHPEYNNDGSDKGSWWSRDIPRELWDQLVGEADRDTVADWTFVDDPASLRAMAVGGDTPDKVFGLAQTDGALTHDRPGDRSEPYATDIAENIVRLDELAVANLNVLDQASDAGFFTVIEEANTDSAGHAGELGRTVENMMEFNNTVDAVVDWVEAESSWDETTVIVTADHETGNLWGTGTLDSNTFRPLTGVEGELPDAEFTDFTDGEPGDENPHYHSHQLVPFYAKGDAAGALGAVVDGTDPVRGDYLLNTSIATTLHEHLRGGDAGEPGEPGEPEPVEDFTDNAPGTKHYAPVRWLQLEGLTNGYDDGSFGKYREISRGESLAFVYRYLDPEYTPEGAPFPDVGAEHTHYAPVSWALENEITQGYADGQFKPTRDVTRAEFASFLHRAIDPGHMGPEDTEFTDVPTSDAAYQAITWLASEALTVGYHDGSYQPDRPITRAEVATLLYRYETMIANEN